MASYNNGHTEVVPIAQLAKGRLSDAGGLRFESQAGRVTGKSTPIDFCSRLFLLLCDRSVGHSVRTTKVNPKPLER